MDLRHRSSVGRTPRVRWSEDALSPPESRVRLHRKARYAQQQPRACGLSVVRLMLSLHCRVAESSMAVLDCCALAG